MFSWPCGIVHVMAVSLTGFRIPPPPPPLGGGYFLLFFYFQTGYCEIDVPFCVRQNSLCLIKKYTYIEPCQYKNIAYHNFALRVSISYSRLAHRSLWFTKSGEKSRGIARKWLQMKKFSENKNSPTIFFGLYVNLAFPNLRKIEQIPFQRHKQTQEPITRSLHTDYILESTFARIFLFLEQSRVSISREIGLFSQ